MIWKQADGKAAPNAALVIAQAASAEFSVPVGILLGTVERETNFRLGLVSSVGAVGPCQFMPQYTNDYYRFNWEYNHININKLVSFLKTIDGFYKDDFIAFTVEDIQNELKFLIGANISLKQNLNSGGYRENKVTVLGTFDRLNRRMVDE